MYETDNHTHPGAASGNLGNSMNDQKPRFMWRAMTSVLVALGLCVGVFACVQSRIPPFSALLNRGERGMALGQGVYL